MKVIRSLEKKGILLKRTTRKIITQEGGFLNFLGPLLKTELSLMKNVLAPLAKSILIPSELTTAASSTDATIQKNTWIRHGSTNNFKQRNGICHQNS